MHRRRVLACVVGLGCAGLGAQERPADFRLDVRPFLARYCETCHGPEDPEAGLDLGLVLGGPLDADGLDAVLDFRDALRSHEMPPKAEDAQPTAGERERMIAWAEHVLDLAAGEVPVDPGRVTMRRLSRFEYANAVRDLTGVAVDVTEFPADDLGYGFDNVGEVLTLSTLHLEKYAAVAGRIADEAWPDPDPDEPPVRRLDGESLRSSLERGSSDGVVVLFTNGSASGTVDLPRPGPYRIRVRAHATQAGPEVARMAVLAAGKSIGEVSVEAGAGDPADHVFEVDLVAGTLLVEAAFTNDFYAPDHPDRSRRDRNLFVHAIEVEGPLDERPATQLEEWLRPLDPVRGRVLPRARTVLGPFVRRAWRRDVSRAELSRLAQVVDDAVDAGESFDAGLRWAIQAALVSPHFLFRIETGGLDGREPETLDDHALASRLSFFLWSSLPDEDLLTRAGAGDLSTEAGILEATDRLLADPRSDALATNFAGQWLELRGLGEVAPDPHFHAGWDAALASSARRETELLFLTTLREALPATTLVDADFTFVDARLAAHYRIPAPDADDGFVRTRPPEGRPGGVLGHASFLALTSNPTRTSPVRRGRWILDNLLDDPPPPPPPGNDSFAGEVEPDSARSLREQMERHRERPACAVCHVRMDALGLALEGFDGIGAARTRDTGGAIDTGSVLPDGRALRGATDLQHVLATDPAFRRALLRKLFVYAVGRGIRPTDALVLERTAARLSERATLLDMIRAIVTMDAFRRRSPAH
ncbi:MAG: DUF1592 domain-containing protein [Planctomycetota bacterium]|nr:DUF1592 domain-containing protein [Planctomycetota bacterium]